MRGRALLRLVPLLVFAFWEAVDASMLHECWRSCWNSTGHHNESAKAVRDWAMHVSAHQQRLTSQFGQDGSIAFVFKNIGISATPYFVEYGFDSSDYKGGFGSNTLQLHNNGWSGLLLDGGHENTAINLHKELITEENVVSIFEKYSVPLRFDFLSNDLDSVDLWVLRAILSAGYRPRVVLAEFNVNYPMESTLTNNNRTGWIGPIFGSSMGALIMMGDEYGYVVVDVVGCDILFVHRSELRGSEFPPLVTWRGKTRRSLFGPLTLSRKSLSNALVDYAIFRSTGSMSRAQAAVLPLIDAMEIFSRYDGEFDLHST